MGQGVGEPCFNKHPKVKRIVWRRPENPTWKVEKKKTSKGKDVKLKGNRVVLEKGENHKARKVKNAPEGEAREGKDGR